MSLTCPLPLQRAGIVYTEDQFYQSIRLAQGRCIYTYRVHESFSRRGSTDVFIMVVVCAMPGINTGKVYCTPVGNKLIFKLHVFIGQVPSIGESEDSVGTQNTLD